MHKTDIIKQLQKENYLGKEVTYRQLEGGVSSDIFMVSDGSKNLVVKQALNQLKVKDDWFADTARNRVECSFTQYVNSFLPGFVPDILYTGEEHDFFVMEYLDSSFSNWKEQLLKGEFDIGTAGKTAGYLADLHIHTFENPEAESLFHSKKYFKSLRTEPYLITTGNRHPQLKNIFRDEAKRLNNQKKALIHGDFSPKNIMTGRGRIVLLDHEVACFGDPVFDVAFLLNHLFLKQLYHTSHNLRLQSLAPVSWQSYYKKWPAHIPAPPEPEVGKLLLLLMLARVDGKSPVEYLQEQQQNFVRSFVYELLHGKVFLLNEIHRIWDDELKNRFNEN